jgi:hypothetical protein
MSAKSLAKADAATSTERKERVWTSFASVRLETQGMVSHEAIGEELARSLPLVCVVVKGLDIPEHLLPLFHIELTNLDVFFEYEGGGIHDG